MDDFATKILALDDKALRNLLEQLNYALEVNENVAPERADNLIGNLRAASNLAIAKLALLRALNSEFIKLQSGEVAKSNNAIRTALENDPAVKFLTKTSFH